MIRKLILALGATIAIAAAALTPTAASAHWHGHWGHGFGFGYYGGPTYVAAPDCYRTKILVDTEFGKRWRRVTVCN
jgi:hypothetical protein